MNDSYRTEEHDLDQDFAANSAEGTGSDANLERHFHSLASDWKANRPPTSSAVKLASHPAYRGLIELGRKHPTTVTRLIIEELERAPDHWFIALQAITGIDPVPPAIRGRVGAMAEAWVQWWRNR